MAGSVTDTSTGTGTTTGADTTGAGVTVSAARTNRTALDAAPIAIWEEDFSEIARFCEAQRAAGVSDIRQLLDDRPFVLADLVGSIRVVNANETAAQLAGAASKEDLLGPIPPDLLTEDSWDTFVDQVAGIFDGKDRLTSESRGVDFAGNPTWHTVHWAAPTVDGAVDYSMVLVMIENTTAHHLAELQRIEYERELRALIDIGARIASTLDEEDVVQQIVDTIPELTGADQALVLLFDRATETLVTSFGHGYGSEDLDAYDYATAMSGISGWVCEAREAASTADISTDPRNTGEALQRARRHPGTRAAVAPIVLGNDVLGTLTALSGPGSPEFTPRQVSLVETLAAQAAVAINNARTHAELRGAHRDLQETQGQLLSAQKMEAIGSLAAGIAHEINTPIQYVGDNVRFLEESSEAVFGLLAKADAIVRRLEESGTDPDQVAEFRAAEDEADLDFILEEAPLAIAQSLEGIERVAEIVRAMKEFAHPGSNEKAPVDLNRSIETTVAVAKNEWKYVADVTTDLDPDLPHVPALAGPLNQSLLIMIVNAAQAIGDFIDAEAGEKGTIDITTRADNGYAIIRVRDDGPGIPADIVDRIFDPFFTTKEVGKGSGQGLSIARNVIVEKHGGSLDVETGAAGGTTFVVKLPLAAKEAAA